MKKGALVGAVAAFALIVVVLVTSVDLADPSTAAKVLIALISLLTPQSIMRAPVASAFSQACRAAKLYGPQLG